MSQNAWIGLIVLAGFIVVIWFIIRGALQVTKRDDGDDDSAGVGVLEGIDEDDEKKRKKRRK